MSKKVRGIVIMGFGIISVLGSLVNGSVEEYMTQGMTVSNIVTVVLQVLLILCGLIIVIKNGDKKNG